MKKIIRSAAILNILFLLWAVTASAGGRYYHTGHRYYGSSYHHYGHHGSHYNSDDVWIYLGVGLLTGVIIGAIANSQPRERTVVYHTPPQIIVNSQPSVSHRVLTTYTSTEKVLSQVETTAYLLNVRSIPDQDADITNQLQQGTVLDVIGAAPEWLYIKTASGQYGWIMKQYTRPHQHPVG